MTEDRKPAKPGLSGVSPKFVDEAEAAVEAAAILVDGQACLVALVAMWA